MHVRYFDDNVVFFGSSRFVVVVFLFRSPVSSPKRNVKTVSPPGFVVDADAAVLCLHDFSHDGKP